MEEISNYVKKNLESTVEINFDENNLRISLIIKPKSQLSGQIASPKEVKDMLRMLGGLKEEVPMDLEIDNEVGEIELKFQNKEYMLKIKEILNGIWDRTIHILNQLEKGHYDLMRELGDFED